MLSIVIGVLSGMTVSLFLCPQLEPLTDVNVVRVAQVVDLCQAGVRSVEPVSDAGKGVATLDGVGTSTSIGSCRLFGTGVSGLGILGISIGLRLVLVRCR